MTLLGGGTLVLTGTNTYSGPTTVNASTLSVNGSLASTVTLANGGMLGGNGTIGGIVSNGGILAPGNSIGTLTVSGNFSQIGGTYVVEANAAGQSDRVNVGGTATINGGAVQVLAQPGNYGRNTTYTILRATGGVSGTYSGVTSNFAFLTPSLTLRRQRRVPDSGDGRTPSRSAAAPPTSARSARVLDQTFATATGDFATVLNAIVGLSTTQGPQTLDVISGQNYAGFGNAMVQGAQLFMTNFANQAAAAAAVARVALAEACDVACDTTRPPCGARGAVRVGGIGTIAGNGNAGTFTYNVGGFAGGLDRSFGPTCWSASPSDTRRAANGSAASTASVTNTVQAGLYRASSRVRSMSTALAGYAYSSNQMWRQIAIAGLQPRTAQGLTGANEFYGQVETGYRFDIGGAPRRSSRPSPACRA